MKKLLHKIYCYFEKHEYNHTKESTDCMRCINHRLFREFDICLYCRKVINKKGSFICNQINNLK